MDTNDEIENWTDLALSNWASTTQPPEGWEAIHSKATLKLSRWKLLWKQVILGKPLYFKFTCHVRSKGNYEADLKVKGE